ncbi:hypothetical protein [Bdellovibrio bacteriovorus]|uniref:Uncharacterized protein n=1 Tax=Bdellovibrio bacteriovorus TaxID=959 RepID=A0A1Z3N660_BDEBC|nr:hypothetical protein [Bdellovibrio bacteriovorus]ASD62927.1 hypothetical protein B9G79_04765 [Bdellovibrio bacteriovorus]
MKLIIILSLILLGVQNSYAACGDETVREFVGDEAVTMAYNVRYASFSKKKTSGDYVSWSIKKLVCVQTNRGILPDTMPTYSCSSPSGVGKITAKAMWDSMSELGVMPDATTGHVYHQAKDIKCQVHKEGDGGTSANPHCWVTAAWGDQCP